MENQFKDLFISYGRRESLGFVGRLHQRLKLADYDAWFDKVNIPDGDDYSQRINHGIESAHNFLYIMAPRCMTSPYCLLELEYARLLGKRVIPINQMVIFEASAQTLSAGEQEILLAFYKHHNLPDQAIRTTQDVLNRSHTLIGQTDWLDAKEKLSEEDCQQLAEWAQPYENNWSKHDDLDYLKSFEFPLFGQSIDALDSVIERITAVLNRQKNYIHQHNKILAYALHWQKNQKATQHLLVGKARQMAEEWLLTEFLAPKQPPCQPTPLMCTFICEGRKNAENLMTDIFICYETHDKAIRNSVIQSLSRYVKTTWIHDRDIQKGADYERAIEVGIENADNFFYFISDHSVVSNYCQRELAHALQYNKRIIPLLIAPTPTSNIPEALRDLQYVDFTDNTCQADYDSDIDDILNILRQDHNYYEQHKFLLARALKWETENRKPSFLLRGHNLDNAQTWLRLNEKRTQHPPLALHQEMIKASEAAKGQLGTEVFISYSRKDSDFARELNKSLQEAGKTTWFDQESISTGVDFEKEIFKGIDGADNFVFVISPDAVESEYCEREVNYAASQNKRFISLLHRETDPDTMPKALRVINWIDFKNIPFKKSFPELIQAIELDREHAHQHTVLQQRASDWVENNSSKDFLLNMTACDKAEIWQDTALSSYKQPAPSELQKTFIEKSRLAITKANRLRNALLTLATVGMIVAFILAVIAFVQMNKANESSIRALASTSKARLGTHDELGALQASVQAASKCRKTFSVQTPDNERLTDNVRSALNEALLIIQERNRFSGHTGKVQAVLFHPNLPIIVSASSDETVKIWHKNGKHLADLQHKNEVSALSISPDGKFLASASFEMVKIWEVNDWMDEKAFQSLPQYELPHKSIKVYDVTFSPDSQKIATASNDGHIRLWQKRSDSWQQINNNKMKHQVPVQAVRFSPNGKLLASASNDRTIKLWQVEHDTVQLKAVLEGHEGKVYAVAFISDAELASASVDTTIRLWDVSDVLSSQNQEIATTLTENRKIEAHANWVLDVQSSPDKKTLASASANGTVKLWSTDGSLLKVFINPSYTTMTTVSFSHDGQSLAAAGGDKVIRLYDLKAASAMKRLEGHTSGIKDVDTGPNKQTMASTGTDGTVRIWDSQTHRLLGKLELKAHARDVDYITPHWLAVATYDNAVQFWQLNRQFKGNKSDTSLKFKGKVKSIAYNSSNKLFAISESEKIDIGKLVFRSESGIFNKLRGYAEHKINEFQGVAKFSEKKPVLENRKKLPIQHKRSIKSLVFSPNGKVLASGGADGRTILWFFDEKGLFAKFKILGGEKEEMGHTDEVNNLGFSHDNRYLASVSSDNSIKLWQVDNGKLLHSIDSEDEDAHQDWLWDVSFAPQQYQLDSEKLIKGEDFYLFVSGSADNTVKLWRFKPPQKLKLVRTIKGHEGWVRSVGFSGDGQYIVSAGADKKMILSEIQGFSENADLEKLLKKGCKILKDYLKHNIDLTKDERKICKGVD